MQKNHKISFKKENNFVKEGCGEMVKYLLEIVYRPSNQLSPPYLVNWDNITPHDQTINKRIL